MSDLIITTDKSYYQQGDSALFTASNLGAGETASFSVAHLEAGADGIYGTADDLLSYDLAGTGITWSITDGGIGDLDGIVNGSITTAWFVNSDANGQAFQLFSTDLGTGETATATFTDAPTPIAAVPAT